MSDIFNFFIAFNFLLKKKDCKKKFNKETFVWLSLIYILYQEMASEAR
jgi:hypothetical protein